MKIFHTFCAFFIFAVAISGAENMPVIINNNPITVAHSTVDIGGETIALPEWTGNVESSRAYKNKLLVSGIAQHGRFAAVIDLQKKEMISAFLHGYLGEHTISPSGRFYIFQKFVPRFAPAEIKCPFLMICDLEKMPEFDIAASSGVVIDIGKFFYPEIEGRKHSREIDYDDYLKNPFSSALMSEWDAESKRAVVLLHAKDGNHVFLILRELENQIEKTAIPFSKVKAFAKGGAEISSPDASEFYLGKVHFENDKITIENARPDAAVFQVVIGNL